MNGKNAIIYKDQEKELQEQTNQKKTFIQDIFNINYVNTSKIYYQPGSQSGDVKVNNYLCYQQGQNLYKVTEIIYEDKLIRIQDTFEVQLDPEKIISKTEVTGPKKQRTNSKNVEKVRIFSKDLRKNGKTEKKDKKNIVKNIVKIFLSWLEKKDQEKKTELWETALKELKNMLQVQNFNNRLIKNLVGNKAINKSFLAFLTDDAEDQIKYSRIQDKQSHYEAIELYISLLTENCNGSRLNSEEFSYSNNHIDGGSCSSQLQDESLDDRNFPNKSQNNMGQIHHKYELKNISTDLNSVNHFANHSIKINNHHHNRGQNHHHTNNYIYNHQNIVQTGSKKSAPENCQSNKQQHKNTSNSQKNAFSQK